LLLSTQCIISVRQQLKSTKTMSVNNSTSNYRYRSPVWATGDGAEIIGGGAGLWRAHAQFNPWLRRRLWRSMIA